MYYKSTTIMFWKKLIHLLVKLAVYCIEKDEQLSNQTAQKLADKQRIKTQFEERLGGGSA